MAWRILFTLIVWLLGLFLQLSDGQVFRNALVLLGADALGCAPWIPFIRHSPGPRSRTTAILVVVLSLVVFVSIAVSLPAAYESQARFNERARGRLPALSGE